MDQTTGRKPPDKGLLGTLFNGLHLWWKSKANQPQVFVRVDEFKTTESPARHFRD